MVLGIIGGVVGLGGALFAMSGFSSALFAMLKVGLLRAFGMHGAGLISNLGFWAIPLSILGIIGGVMVSIKPVLAGKLMIASAIGGLILIHFGYTIAAILLIIAGILAIMEEKKEFLGIPNNVKDYFTIQTSTASILPWYKKKWVIALSAVFGILIVIGTVGAISGKWPGSNADKYDFATNVEGTGKIKGIFVNNVGIAVENVSRAKTLGDKYSRYTAQGEFVIVSIIVSNHQKEIITVDANMFKLLDGAGREYSPSYTSITKLEISSKLYNRFFLTSINPGITTIGFVTFDIPVGITDLKLEVQDSTTDDKGTLPLQVIMADGNTESKKVAAINVQKDTTNNNNQSKEGAEKKISFMGRIKGEEVRMRAEPSTDSKIIGAFNNQEIIHAIATIKAGEREWYKVTRDNGSSGWVAKEFCMLGE